MAILDNNHGNSMPLDEQNTNQLRNLNSSPNVGGVLTNNFMTASEPANMLATSGKNHGVSSNQQTAQSHYDSKENLNDAVLLTNSR